MKICDKLTVIPVSQLNLLNVVRNNEPIVAITRKVRTWHE